MEASFWLSKVACPPSISGVAGGSQQLTVLEAEVNLTGNEWQKHPTGTGSEAPSILGIDYCRRGYFKDPKGYWWAFGTAALEMEEIKQLSTWPGLSEDPSVVGLLRVEEQPMPIAITTTQEVISKTRSPINSPIWPVRKSNGEWRLTVDYRGLNEVTPPLSAAVPDMLELQYELESKAAKWYATIDTANTFFSIPLVTECRPQFAFTWRGIQYTWNLLPQGWKHSPTICRGLIQVTLEQGEVPEHLQYIDDIIVWGNRAEEVFEKGKKIVQILMKATFAIKQRIKWQDGHHQIPVDGINKITAMSPPTSEEETQAFLEVVGTEAQLLLALQLPVLGWMFKGRVPSTHHAIDATWSKWVTLITQQAGIGNPSCPGILEVIMDWPEGKDFRISPEEEVMCAEKAPLYNK
ncbi:hypothetical protein QYF61_009559 [Mycteria americana]|uniref:ribonuclease H n=1 Tax=Mycteria americana TaxID=33587 RepID=A0AAN7SDG9_MYCAM|nr:hypothetical protein QYF61_009559 [Mycteria americana]